MVEVTQADMVAAEAQAKKHYQTAYDYEMDLREAFANHRIKAAKAERDRIVGWLRNLPNEMVGSIAKKHFVSFEVAKLIGRDLATAFEKEQQP